MEGGRAVEWVCPGEFWDQLLGLHVLSIGHSTIPSITQAFVGSLIKCPTSNLKNFSDVLSYGRISQTFGQNPIKVYIFGIAHRSRLKIYIGLWGFDQ